MTKKAIITGITGQDGAYLAKLLLDKNYEVFGITRDALDLKDKNLKYLNIQDQVRIIELPELNRERIIKILEKVAPDEIYNLSSQSSVGHSFKDPYTTLEYNVMSVLYWLEAINTVNPVIRYYQASSSEMFGNVRASDLPLKESLIFRPASPYGISKASAHWLVVNYRESHHIYCTCGILFNHESPLRGPNYVVKKVINTALKIKLGLYNEKLVLGNLDIQRDWGYAPEYVKAMWLMLQQEHPEDFMICSGNVMSLRELVAEVFRQLELNFEEHVVQDSSLFRPTDLEKIFGDNTKAKKKLGWSYDLSNKNLIHKLIEDEQKFITWELSQGNGKAESFLLPEEGQKV